MAFRPGPEGQREPSKVSEQERAWVLWWHSEGRLERNKAAGRENSYRARVQQFT